ELTFDSDEETTVSYNLDFKAEEPDIKSVAKPQRPRRAPVRRDDVRRALFDQGLPFHAPGDRGVEPLWRTPDRPDSTRWARLAQTAAPPKRPPRAVLVDLRGEPERQGQRYVEVAIPVE